jgi:hypothetical protein
VPGLVEAQLGAAGEPNRCHQTEALVADRTAELDPFALELVDCRLGVVAHEIELVMAGLVCWVRGQLSGWQREDEPAMSRIDRRELEHVSEESADPVGVAAEDDRVDPGDHECGALVAGPAGDRAIQESSSDWVR